MQLQVEPRRVGRCWAAARVAIQKRRPKDTPPAQKDEVQRTSVPGRSEPTWEKSRSPEPSVAVRGSERAQRVHQLKPQVREARRRHIFAWSSLTTGMAHALIPRTSTRRSAPHCPASLRLSRAMSFATSSIASR